jgi:hypothetical protein
MRLPIRRLSLRRRRQMESLFRSISAQSPHKVAGDEGIAGAHGIDHLGGHDIGCSMRV